MMYAFVQTFICRVCDDNRKTEIGLKDGQNWCSMYYAGCAEIWKNGHDKSFVGTVRHWFGT